MKTEAEQSMQQAYDAPTAQNQPNSPFGETLRLIRQERVKRRIVSEVREFMAKWGAKVTPKVQEALVRLPPMMEDSQEAGASLYLGAFWLRQMTSVGVCSQELCDEAERLAARLELILDGV